MVRHFLDLFDLTTAEVRTLLDRSLALKRKERAHRSPMLTGRTLGLLFEKPSLRTRVSFEAAIAQLGGAAIFLSGQDVGLGARESVADFARVVSQYVDVLAVRTYAQSRLVELARHASVPVINALSDTAHPCQAMADMLTVHEELGRVEGARIVFVGDGNNVASSLATAAAFLGAEFVLSCPEGYSFPTEFTERYATAFPGIALRIEHDPFAAVRQADVVYTDVWASMGQEAESAIRRAVFEPYRVHERLLQQAQPEAIFLHCLPAHRGDEVTDEVLDGPRSRVIPQAANRLHFQKELLVWLLADGQTPSPARANSRRRTRPV